MKIKWAVSIFLFIFLSLNAAFAQTKRALIFAIGNYPVNSGWPKISSVSDISYIQTALEGQQFHDIKVVKDDAATVTGITNSLNELIGRANPGDVVLIHFSSHGELIEDDKKRKINGLEECIVAYDAKLPPGKAVPAPAEFEKLKNGYLREDVFGTYINKLRTKVGKNGDVLILMDLCHAGVGTRGLAKVRGGKPALVSANFGKKQAAIGGGSDYDIEAATKIDQSAMSSYEVIGAARSEELDYEITDENNKEIGSLSYAISKVFADPANVKNISYKGLFAQVRSIMNEKSPLQHPVLAGNGENRLLFGGRFVPKKQSIELNKIAGLKVTLNAGTLSGLDVGAQVSIYPLKTTDTSNVKPLATGRVNSATLYTSIVTIDQPLDFTQPAMGQALVTARVYKFAPLKIEIVQNKMHNMGAVNFSDAAVANMKSSLQTLPSVSFDNISPDLKITKGPLVDSIIIAANGSLFDVLKHAATDTALLKSKVKAYMQYGFLKNLKLTEPGTELDIRLVPVHHGKPDTSNVGIENPSNAFADGDTVMIWANNPTGKSLYFNILDMQPNGEINPVVPIRNASVTISPEELFIKPGVSHILNYPIELGPPYGTEVFKIFVSEKLIDMTAIANTRGTVSRGNFSPLESLFQASYSAGTRSGISSRNASGSVYSLLFEIRPKK